MQHKVRIAIRQARRTWSPFLKSLLAVTSMDLLARSKCAVIGPSCNIRNRYKRNATLILVHAASARGQHWH